jgi:hypothetical protein
MLQDFRYRERLRLSFAVRDLFYDCEVFCGFLASSSSIV